MANKTLKWKKSKVSENEFRTEKFGNLLSDKFRGSVYISTSNKWTGILENLSNIRMSKFKIGFASDKAAKAWVKKQLISVGVKF